MLGKQKLNFIMWLGTEVYSGAWGVDYYQEDVDKIIKKCYELGINKIDTAGCYGNNNYVEKLIGNAIETKRDYFELATKFGQHSNNNIVTTDFRIDSIKAQLENSLKMLKTDYIDIYYFHSGEDKDFFNDKLWSLLNDYQKSGVIKKLGLSIKHSLVKNDNHKQLKSLKSYGISVVQTVLNLFSQESLKYVIPYCLENNIRVLGRMPLAKGLLSGKYKVGNKFKENDSRSKYQSINESILKIFSKTDVYDSLRWCKKYLDEIVIGSKNVNQLTENHCIINNIK